MANLTYTGDVIDDVLFRAGEPVDGTSDFNAAVLEYVNRAYRAIWMGGGEFVEDMNEPWLWLKKDPPAVLTIMPYIETGTIAVTNNSTSATLSAAQALDLDGYFLKVDGHPDVFRVSAHTAAGTAVTLDGVYTGEDETAATYRLMKLEYALAADILRLIGPLRVQSDNESEIQGIDLSALDRDYPLLNLEAGTPDRFALVTETKVRFNKCGGTSSTDLRRVEYDYLYKPSDLTDSGAEVPVVPREHLSVLSDIALFYLFQAKSDLRMEVIGVQARAGLKAMQKDNRARLAQIGRHLGHLTPRPGRISQYNRVLRTTSGVIIG